MRLRINLSNGTYITTDDSPPSAVDQITRAIADDSAYVMYLGDGRRRIFNASHIVDVEVTP